MFSSPRTRHAKSLGAEEEVGGIEVLLFSRTVCRSGAIWQRGEANYCISLATCKDAMPIAHGLLVTQGGFRDNARLFERTAVTMNLHEYQAKDIFRSYGI